MGVGYFAGHLLPGLALTSLGIWHGINTICVYFLTDSTKFMLSFWYPVSKLKYLELKLVFTFSVLAILSQVFDFQHLRFSFELDSLEHGTMFLQIVIFTSFTLFCESNHLSESMLGVSSILVASIFGQELFLLHYHSTEHVELEGHYHWLMQLIVCVSFLATLYATTCPSSFPAALILSISVVFQGCWFVNMGFMLYIPIFVSRGCSMQPINPSIGIMHGAVVCETNEAYSRARALANLQFCWIISSILVVMASVCMAYGRQCGRRKQSLEYEQISNPGTPDPLAAVGLTEIQL